MQAIIKNLTWIAPTAAIVLSTSFLGTTWLINRDDAAAAQKASSDAISLQVEAGQRRLDELNALVEAASAKMTETIESRSTLPALDAPAVETQENEVTRNEPLQILETPTQVAPVANVDRVNSAAAFFAAAQENLANDESCADDLKSLASSTRIYFPAGGLTAEATGLIQARVIGQLARSCPGFTVQVEGHSDPSGDPVVNKELSEKRAQAVIGRLASGGVDVSNFVAIGRGDEVPSGLDGPKGAAYYDRRVEFSIVKAVKTASIAPSFSQMWRTEPSDCARALERKVEQSRLIYAPRAITVSPSELEAVFELATAAARCDGVRLRLVGQHSDEMGTRETAETGRLRALVLMGSLVSAGYVSESILIGAPSYSVAVPGQPGLPKSRVDFQIIMD